jgi:hypothetical protein
MTAIESGTGIAAKKKSIEPTKMNLSIGKRKDNFWSKSFGNFNDEHFNDKQSILTTSNIGNRKND